eukprot:3940808-Rhodomonas_salina.1
MVPTGSSIPDLSQYRSQQHTLSVRDIAKTTEAYAMSVPDIALDGTSSISFWDQSMSEGCSSIRDVSAGHRTR